MLRTEGWAVNHKRVERIWRQEGLKVPSKQPKRGRLWLTDGSCIRLRPLYRHHVWAYDFVVDRTHDGRPLKMLTVLDEYSRKCLAIVVARRLQADDVLQTLSELFAEHGPPANLRSDNGPEFTARVVRQWLGELGVKTLFIEPGSPWENGYNESFNGTLRNELLKREIFYSLQEAKVLIEQWRREYNTHRPHSSLGYRPPAPEAIRPDPKLLNLPLLLGPPPSQKEVLALKITLDGTAFGGSSVGSYFSPPILPALPRQPPGPPSVTPPSSPDIFVMEISATHLRHDAVDLGSEARGEGVSPCRPQGSGVLLSVQETTLVS